MEITQYAALFQALNNAGKTLAALIEQRDLARNLDQLIEARQQILQALDMGLGAKQQAVALQEELQAARAKADQLAHEVEAVKAEISDLSGYRLVELAPGALVYGPREGYAVDEPPHYLCAACRDDAKKSLLQFAGYEKNFRLLRCGRCGGEVRVREPMGDIMTIPSDRGF